MKKEQTISDHIWQFFCSVKLAVYTLVLLAITSVIGTVILQNGDPRQYLNEYGPGFYNFIKVFQFDDMYHAWWFLGLIIILCVNIVVCSIERLTFTWKIIFPKKIFFNKDRFRKQKNIETISVNRNAETLSGEYQTLLSRKVGTVIKEKTDDSIVLYAEKGRWTRIGVYVVHASILLLLVGALIGSMFGFKASLRLDEGQTSDTVFMSQKGITAKLGFSIRCNDFSVKFYKTGAPEEFKSNLTIVENGKDSFTKDILVNHPLRYKGINIFQSSYGSAGAESLVLDIVKLSDNTRVTHTLKVGDYVKLPDNQGKFLLESFTSHYDFRGQELGDAFLGKVIPKEGEPFKIGLPLRYSKFDRMRKGTFAFVIKDTEQKYYTGLQVTKDPGIWYVYSGFVLMILGCWITFFMTHQSYMIEIKSSEDEKSTVFVSGITNRSSQGMKLKIQKLLIQLKGK